LWVETIEGLIERHQCNQICELTLSRFARQVAALSHQAINRQHPLLGASLPDGSRIQVVAPPATRGAIAVAIRRQVARRATLRELAGHGSNKDRGTRDQSGEKLQQFVDEGRFVEALELAVQSRRNIVVSGGTSTGKTTYLNALLREIPSEERLIFIEDTPELHIEHENSVGFIATRSELGESGVTMNDLVSASLRMRPDRIILGELRGREAFAFLRAVNSGHPGSMTTIHANSPAHAVEQLAMLILHEGTNLSRADVRYYVGQSIDMFVQLRRIAGSRVIETIKLGRQLGREA
jgi:type IV secretion system protein VirB11